MSGYQTIRYERQAGIGTLILARPEVAKRAEPADVGRSLYLAGHRAAGGRDAPVPCCDREGLMFSSAGIDLVEGIGGLLAGWSRRAFGRGQPRGRPRRGGDLQLDPGPRLCQRRRRARPRLPRAGLQLALACDFRVFAEGTKVGLVETRYGLLPDMGATVRLPRIVGESRARELILLGEVIDAEEALRIGLANRVVGDEDLDATAASLAAGWPLSRRSPYGAPGARSRRRGTALPSRASWWPLRSSCAALGPMTSRKHARR